MVVCRVCVECGQTTQQALYKEYSGGSIQLCRCEHCKCVLDKYMERELVILLLDLLLLRVEAYRHLIFNYGISASVLWKLMVVLVLCEGYTKLRLLGLESPDSILVQLHFHTLFIQSLLEYCVLLALVHCLCLCLPGALARRVSFMQEWRMVVIGSYGKCSVLAAMVWAGDFYLWFPYLLVLPAQLQAFRALLGAGVCTAAVAVSVQNALLLVSSSALAGWRNRLVHYILLSNFNVVHMDAAMIATAAS